MKRIEYLLSFCFLVLLISCSSDDGDATDQEPSLVVGTYTLTEVNINIAQDPNEDGVASTNMLDELPCLTGSLTVNADGTWSMSLMQLIISPVTGDLYGVRCANDNTSSYEGNYSFQNGLLNLNSSVFSSFTLSNGTLIENINEDLPGILNRRFQRQ